jgi:UDP-N-acetylglucosamine 4,6-dehydratase
MTKNQSRTYFITGGTGSLGNALIRHLLNGQNKIIVYSRDEFKQRHMLYDLNDKRVSFAVGDVRDLPRLTEAMRGVDIVIHAAALKHVPVGEEIPLETIKTNIIGSANVIQAAKDNNVKKCILVSTDKASHPVTLYGGTKLCAEKLFIAANLNSKTIFSCVRYGNVIGSRGSVIETILKDKPQELEITDKRMTRFWLTLDQACKFILEMVEVMKGGEVFVPKIPSMKVTQMFRALAPSMKLIETGPRPGEKLHECLINEDESHHTEDAGSYYAVLPELLGADYHDYSFTYTSLNSPRLTGKAFRKLCKNE